MLCTRLYTAAAAPLPAEQPHPPSSCRRLVDLLLPGENVLQALRRLAAVRQPLGASPGGGAANGGSPPGDPLARHPRALRTQAMPAGVQEKFEQLVRR